MEKPNSILSSFRRMDQILQLKLFAFGFRIPITAKIRGKTAKQNHTKHSLKKRWLKWGQYSLMNDFSEVQYGTEILSRWLRSDQGNVLYDTLEKVRSGIVNKVAHAFNHWQPYLAQDAYITCLSEHDKADDLHGRLSMWTPLRTAF